MRIVIDIPEEAYDDIHSLKFVLDGFEANKQMFYRLINAVQDGKVLPEEHGDLIDREQLKISVQEYVRRTQGLTYYDLENVESFNSGVESALDDIVDAPTIVEGTSYGDCN